MATDRRGSHHYLTGLDWLRFGLAVYLVLFHTLRTAPWLDGTLWQDLLGGGYFATSAFFALSGFLLAHIYINQDGSMRGDGARGFWINRISSVYLVHVISMLLVIGTQLPLVFANNGYPPPYISHPEIIHDMGIGSEQSLSYSEISANFILHLLLLQAWNPLYHVLNIASWALSALAFFYLVFPWAAVALWRVRNKKTWLAFLVGVYGAIPCLFIAKNWFGVPETGILFFNPALRLPEFLSGILLCFVLKASPRFAGGLAQFRHIGIVVALAITAVIFLRFSSPSWPEAYLLHNGLLLPLQLALIAIASTCCLSAGHRHVKLARQLGSAAIALFGFHSVVYWLCRVLPAFAAGYPELLANITQHGLQAGVQALQQTTQKFLSPAEYVAYLVLVVIFCVAINQWLVQPARRRIRSYLQGHLRATHSH